MAKATHVWAVIEDVLISLTTSGMIPDDQWKGWLRDLQTRPVRKCIGVTYGATEITSLMRKEATETTRRRDIKVAVVTDESLVRGIVTAARWIGAPINSFSWSNTTDAMKWLEVAPPLEVKLMHWLDENKRRLKG